VTVAGEAPADVGDTTIRNYDPAQPARAGAGSD
jgi:hypothetical protein